MKNQYVGDINDYLKYGLLRVLASAGKLTIGICWMLSEGDATGHGGSTQYLNRRSTLRQCDPDLFDCLHDCVNVRQIRNVNEIERLDMIPSAVYHNEQLGADPGQRVLYFARAFEKFAHADIIFFDPDTGVEVPSVPLGRKKAPKYLYWHELCCAFTRGHSVLVYQHYPHQPHKPYSTTLAARMKTLTAVDEIYCFSSSRVAFFLISHGEHRGTLQQVLEDVQTRWSNELSCWRL